MNIQEIELKFDELVGDNPKVESWVIRRNGKVIRLPNGKSIWRRKNHAGAALTNYVSNIDSYDRMKELRKDLGLDRNDSLGQYLLEKGIVTIEKI